MNNNRPIGVFDSGLGGLTAVNSIAKLLPNERFLYFGDTARTPYGSKNKNTIIKFAIQITDFLVRNDAKIIVIACNTVSAVCLEILKDAYKGIPIIGIIDPTAKYIAENYDEGKNIGIIGTKVTVKSDKYRHIVENNKGKCKIFSKSCPLFVPIIEEGIRDETILKSIVKYYLEEFMLENEITSLVLGCTHYPLIQDTIKCLYPKIEIINPSQIIAEEVYSILKKEKLIAEKNPRENHFYASDLSEEFVNMIKKISDEGTANIKSINFEESLGQCI